MSEQTATPIKTLPSGNPLANYFRQPKIYIKLPSRGQFYPEDSLDISQNGEYAVYAMTAKDELMFKTPDALMNGQATVEVIKSCVPAIRDPWKMPSIDLDAVLIAIRIATHGEKMDITANCPSCDFENSYSMALVDYLSSISSFEYERQIHVDPLVINIRPYSYREVSKTAIRTLEQQKIFDIVNNESMSDEDKIEKFGESFVKLTQLTVDVVTGCIESIDTPEGSVTDKKFINEFVQNASSEVFNNINTRILSMKENMSLKAQKVQCQECKHDWSVEVTMDQTNFFAAGS
jgi:hypothetical protein